MIARIWHGIGEIGRRWQWQLVFLGFCVSILALFGGFNLTDSRVAVARNQNEPTFQGGLVMTPTDGVQGNAELLEFLRENRDLIVRLNVEGRLQGNRNSTEYFSLACKAHRGEDWKFFDIDGFYQGQKYSIPLIDQFSAENSGGNHSVRNCDTTIEVRFLDMERSQTHTGAYTLGFSLKGRFHVTYVGSETGGGPAHYKLVEVSY
jgi:hypothetical protein